VTSDRKVERALATLKPFLLRVNEEWRARIAEFQKEAMSNIEGEIRWFKLNQNNK
jgi:hypothetical protein